MLQNVRLFLALAGAGLVAIGLWLIYPPVALVALGGGFVYVAYRLESTHRQEPRP